MTRSLLAITALIALLISGVCQATTVTGGLSGTWGDPTHDGEGFIVQVLGSNAVVFWFTYDRSGKQRWIYGVGDVSGSKISINEMLFTQGGKFGPDFDPEDVEYPVWGSLELDFSNCTTATASYTGPNAAESGQQNLKRITSPWGMNCDGSSNPNVSTGVGYLNSGFTGIWGDQSHDGEGFTLEILDEDSALFFWFTYDTQGNQAWMYGVGDIEGASIIVTDVLITSGGIFGQDFDPSDVSYTDWGAVAFTFGDCNNQGHSGAMRYLPPENFGIESTQFLYRVVQISGLSCQFLASLNSLSATVSAAENVEIDGDVNNPSVRLIKNDLEGANSGSQQLFPPARVVGYVTAEATGKAGDRFESNSDEWDVYLLALRAGESVSLTGEESEGSKTVDLDLYLRDVNEPDTTADSSTSPESKELVTAPKDGNYWVFVQAFDGSSNYVLESGIYGQQQANKLTFNSDFEPNIIMASPKSGNSGLARADQNNWAKKVADSEKRLKLQRVDESPSNTVLYSTPSVALPSLTPHPLAAVGVTDITPEEWHLMKLAKKLASDPAFNWAGPNYIQSVQATPNDQYFGFQWHFGLLRLPQAWDITKGDSNVVVAVIDSGVAQHPDLEGRVQFSLGYDFVSNPFESGDGNGRDSDARDPGKSYSIQGYFSHGTHVAGTIGAKTNNGVGVAGVDWNATIMPVRVLGVNGTSNCFDSNESLRWAGRLANASGLLPAKKADVINLSLGGPSPCFGQQEIIDQLVSNGAIVIAAAGNNSTALPFYPASFGNVISVSATTIRDGLAPYSNYGSTIDLAAPGGNSNLDLNSDSAPDGVLSTAMVVEPHSSTKSVGYTFSDGTSMAAPHVSGVFALMKAVYPNLGSSQFQAGLTSGALTIDLANNGASTKDSNFGYGRLDAVKAVQWAKQQADQPTTAFLSSDRSVLDFSSATQSIEFNVQRAGTGSLQVSSFGDSESWITISSISTDSNGFGRYRVNVNRSGLIEGQYSGWVAFDANDGTRLWISVLMRVGQVANGEIGWAAGLMLDEWTLSNVKQWTGTDLNGPMNMVFPSNPPGSYYLMVGTDNDNDNIICDEGELCQLYPNNARPTPLEIDGSNVSVGSFIVGFPTQNGVSQQSASQANSGPNLLDFQRVSGKYKKNQ